MSISSKKSKGKITVFMKGEISIYSISELYQCLCNIEELFDGNLSLDLSEVTEIDTAGVQLIMFLRKKMKSGKSLSIDKSTDKVNQTLELLGFERSKI